MDTAKNLLQVFEAIDKAHLQQKSVVLSFTLSVDGKDEPEPLSLEFEIMPPTPELTDKAKKEKKK